MTEYAKLEIYSNGSQITAIVVDDFLVHGDSPVSGSQVLSCLIFKSLLHAALSRDDNQPVLCAHCQSDNTDYCSTVSGTQSNGCDVDLDTCKCNDCGETFTDV